jgi:predicted outer membrane repeat protein
MRTLKKCRLVLTMAALSFITVQYCLADAVFTEAIDMNGHAISNAATPGAGSPGTQVATKDYVDSLAGLADENTLFISSTAPAGGDGSMGKPWNSLLELADNTGNRLNGKTIIICAGEYLVSAAVTFDNSYSNVTVKGLDRQNVKVTSSDSTAHIFNCETGAINIVFKNMTLTSSNSQRGGAIYLREGCAVYNCIFDRSQSTHGGAVYCYYGGTVDNCSFTGNRASQYGGGIYCEKGGTVRNCTFSGNAVVHGGGGIYCDEGGTVQNCTFNGNSASGLGGGVECNQGGVIQNCSFNGNEADHGGAVYFTRGGAVYSSSINTNSAVRDGGGIHCYRGGTLQNSTVTGNTAERGGGIFCLEGGTINYSRFTMNYSTGRGGGAYCYQGGTFNTCSFIRQGGNTNSLYSTSPGVKWMSTWTNDINSHCFVIYSTDLDN